MMNLELSDYNHVIKELSRAVFKRNFLIETKGAKNDPHEAEPGDLLLYSYTMCSASSKQTSADTL
jgi:hypothetical protein